MGTETVATRFAASAGDTILVRARTLSHGRVSEWSSNVTVSAPSAPTIPPPPEYTEASYYEIPIDSGGNTSIYLYAKIVSDETASGYDSISNLTYRLDHRYVGVGQEGSWQTGTPVPANQTENYQGDGGGNVSVVVLQEPVAEFGDYEVRLSATNSAGTSDYTYVEETSDQASSGNRTGNMTL